MCLTSEVKTPITPLFMNENIQCGYSFSYLERKEQCGTKIICVFHFFFFFFLIACLENWKMPVYCINKKRFFFFGEYQIYFHLVS